MSRDDKTLPRGQRYEQLAHAMQTGVAFDQEQGSRCGTPKHLRVGVNMAMVEIGALGKLLVAKGIITKDELELAILDGLEAEVARYEKHLSDKLGTQVHLA